MGEPTVVVVEDGGTDQGDAAAAFAAGAATVIAADAAETAEGAAETAAVAAAVAAAADETAWDARMAVGSLEDRQAAFERATLDALADIAVAVGGGHGAPEPEPEHIPPVIVAPEPPATPAAPRKRRAKPSESSFAGWWRRS